MKACKGFLQHGHRFFNLLFKPFPTLSMSSSLFLFVVVFVSETQPVIVVKTCVCGQSEREALLRAVCLLPRALVGRPCREKSIVGDPAKIKQPSRQRRLALRVLKVPSKTYPPTAESRRGVAANIDTILPCTVAQCLRGKRATKLGGVLQLVVVCSLFLCFAL